MTLSLRFLDRELLYDINDLLTSSVNYVKLLGAKWGHKVR